MTIITFKPCEVEIKGHSGYGTNGNDIVCSALSSIVTTTVNAILKHNSNAIEIKQEEALVDVKILKRDKFINLLLDNMKKLLEELEVQYQKNVKVEVLKWNTVILF